jgi:hypothetical protein
MANILFDYSNKGPLTADIYYQVLSTYSNTQRDPDGSPMVREDHHPDENRWIAKGANYNHSGFADLVITGFLGVRPQPDDSFVLNPTLIPRSWAFFCLEDLPYHGHLITVLYDRDGSKYSRGSGLQVLVNGAVAFHSTELAPVSIQLQSPPSGEQGHVKLAASSAGGQPGPSVASPSAAEQGGCCGCLPWLSEPPGKGEGETSSPTVNATVV